jgi:uncharacterized protein YkwD
MFSAVVGSSDHQAKHEDAVLRLANIVRMKAGLPQFRPDERLRTAARGHSRDMARRGFCAHENPDGASPADRIRAAGYPHPGGENVARGQETAAIVMDAWMNSPGHRANLLNPQFATLGVGAYFLHQDGPHWTQNFGY